MWKQIGRARLVVETQHESHIDSDGGYSGQRPSPRCASSRAKPGSGTKR